MHYYGIADAHGLESFFQAEDNSKVFHRKRFLQLRASLNRHRHACFYELSINKFEAKLVRKLLDNKMYKSALQVVKAFQKVEVLDSYKNSWDLIPNPDLDPWHAGEDGDGLDDPENLNLEEYVLQNHK